MTTFDYYVYLLLDPTDYFKPFYVGKGIGDRMFHHFQESAKGENRFKENKIAKIRRAGVEPIATKWAERLDEVSAYELEAHLIQRFGRRNIDPDGILTNICIDSRPPSALGREVSQETRDKISNAQSGELNHRFGKSFTEEQRASRSQIIKDLGIKPPVQSGPMPEDQRIKIGNGNRGKKRTDAVRSRFSEMRKGVKKGPPSKETIEKIRASNIGIKKRKMTDIEKEIHSERVRAYWANLTPEEKVIRLGKRNKKGDD
jgi:hypothetical protein